jgi:integrase
MDSVLHPVSENGRVLARGLHPDSIGLIIKRAAARAGMDTRSIAGHSLRAGCVTQAAKNGVPDRQIMKQTGHKSVAMLQRYVRDLKILEQNAATRLGI